MKIDIIDIALVAVAIYLFFQTPAFPDEIVPLAIEIMRRRWVKL